MTHFYSTESKLQDIIDYIDIQVTDKFLSVASSLTFKNAGHNISVLGRTDGYRTEVSFIVYGCTTNVYIVYKKRCYTGHIDFPLGDGTVYGHDLTCNYIIEVEFGKVS